VYVDAAALHVGVVAIIVKSKQGNLLKLSISAFQTWFNFICSLVQCLKHLKASSPAFLCSSCLPSGCLSQIPTFLVILVLK